jgi:putative DNA primase/helicase
VTDPPEDPGHDPGPDEPIPPPNVIALAGRKPRAKKEPRQRRGDWTDLLCLTAQGHVRASVANVDTVLRHDPAYAGKLRRNLMSAQDEHDGAAMPDESYTRLRIHCGREYGFDPSKDDAIAAIAGVACESAYHPVADYLRSLAWDGQPRISWFLRDVLRAPETPLYQAMIRRWFVAAVARPLRPGCKVDTMLVLQGAQGARKSTLFRALSSPWFVDSSMSLDNKDAYMILSQSWLAEWPELDVVSKASREKVKAFLSSPEDCYRAPYARGVIRVLRTQSIVGTTNAEEFLGDPTGSRRFWPIAVGAIDLELATAWRDQLWAEAVAAFDAGERWWLDESEEALRATDAATWEHTDAWGDVLLPWASTKLLFTTHEALEDGLSLKPKEITRGHEMRVAELLRRAGYAKRRDGSGGRDRRWSRQTDVQPRPTSETEVGRE